MRASTSLAAAVLLCVASQQAGAATQPNPGIYIGQGRLTAVTPTGGATDCPSAGQTVSFYLQYPGPALPGATFYSPALPHNVLAVQMGTFPTTPAAGVKAWSGKVQESDSAGNKRTVPFAASLTYYTASAFLMNISKWNEPSLSGGTCNEVVQLALIRTGAL